MQPRRTVLRALVCSLALAGSAALAQSFPTKPITVLVPFPPGGLTDQMARIVAQHLQDSLGQPAVVENRPGAGGQIAATQLTKGEADGHALLLGDSGVFAINPSLYRKFSFDPLKDFEPVTPIASSPLVLIVPPNSPANSVGELLSLAKSKAGGLHYASQGNGTVGHLLGELFRSRTGANLGHVAYKGVAPAVNDVMGGHVDMLFASVGSASPLIQSGKVKALAVTGAKRSPALPQVSTLTEAGVSDVDVSVWWGIVAKAGTPKPVVAKLNAAIAKAMSSPDVVKRMTDQGVEIDTRSAPQFGTFMKAETARWAPIIKSSGATID